MSARRQLEAGRVAWGAAGLLAPRAVARRLGSPEPDERAVLVTRVLGARQLTQGLLSGLRPGPGVLAVGVWVDTLHAATAVGLAALDRRRAGPALADAGIAATFAVLGRRDLLAVRAAAPGTAAGGWQERVARDLLPVLPGAPGLEPVAR